MDPVGWETCQAPPPEVCHLMIYFIKIKMRISVLYILWLSTPNQMSSMSYEVMDVAVY